MGVWRVVFGVVMVFIFVGGVKRVVGRRLGNFEEF